MAKWKAVHRCRVELKRIIMWGRERYWGSWLVVFSRWFRSRLVKWAGMRLHSSLPWTNPCKSWRIESQNLKIPNPNHKSNLQTPNWRRQISSLKSKSKSTLSKSRSNRWRSDAIRSTTNWSWKESSAWRTQISYGKLSTIFVSVLTETSSYPSCWGF